MKQLHAKISPHDLAVVVLAAGKGTRMGGNQPKVLYKLAGRSMLEHVIETVREIDIKDICLILQEDISPFSAILDQYPNLTVCSQFARNGTGGAAAVAGHCIEGIEPPSFAMGSYRLGPKLDPAYLLILAGDTPNLHAGTLASFIHTSLENDWDLSVCGMEVPDPTGYGRLVYDDKNLLRAIIEEKDADSKILAIKHCNSGVLFAKTKPLFTLLALLEDKNKQREFYLTDCVALAHHQKMTVGAFLASDWERFLGVNTIEQLRLVESKMESVSYYSLNSRI